MVPLISMAMVRFGDVGLTVSTNEDFVNSMSPCKYVFVIELFPSVAVLEPFPVAL